MYEIWWRRVTHQYLQKSISVPNPKPNRKFVISNFLCKFCAVFAIFRRYILTNTSKKISGEFGQCNRKPSLTLSISHFLFHSLYLTPPLSLSLSLSLSLTPSLSLCVCVAVAEYRIRSASPERRANEKLSLYGG